MPDNILPHFPCEALQLLLVVVVVLFPFYSEETDTTEPECPKSSSVTPEILNQTKTYG